MSLISNWLEWCIRFRIVVPWSMRLVAQRRHARQIVERALAATRFCWDELPVEQARAVGMLADRESLVRWGDL